MEIITNNQPRKLKYGYELPKKLRAEFDYIPDEDFEFRDFVYYKGQYYDLAAILTTGTITEFKGWDGYASDSYFSGIVIKMLDTDTVIVGRYFS